ncbi:MAG: FAD:protein FMN transferase, partial [Planctomycetes bacterium]|nr:FAD:protein FMN transferase [Planctomycetota bacterium]
EETNLPTYSTEIIPIALDLCKNSQGAFDITLSPILDLWGFEEQQERRLPKAEEIESILQHIGYEKLIYSPARSSLRKSHDQLEINLSAIAKGYGVDLIAQILESQGIKNFMVEIGGEICTKGKPNNRPHWSLGIRRPEKELNSTELMMILTANNIALATSGDYLNTFTVEGQEYPHIFDPKTGYPVTHNLCSVSVIAPQCAIADGLATACLVLGKEEALGLLEKYPDCHAYFVERKENGSFVESFSPGFPHKAINK